MGIENIANVRGILIDASIESAKANRKKLETAFISANEICRSALEIARRKGYNTNWEGFERKVEKSLKIQQEFINKR